MLFLDVAASGVVTGVFYALIALGLTLIFGILRVVNFAHGEFFMVGGFAYVLAFYMLGLPVWVALPVAVASGALLGYLTEALLMRPLYANIRSWRRLRDEYAIIVTFGLSLFLIAAVDKGVGPWSYRGPELSEADPIAIGTMQLSAHRVAALAISAACLGSVMLFLRYTLWGRRIRAVSQNRLAASIMGVDVGSASAIVFVVSGALAALAGALLSPIINPSPDVGGFAAVKSYVIIVLGGMGSPLGAVLGALILGLVESLGAFFVSSAYRDTYGLVLLMAVLAIRPQGLLGEIQREA